MTLETDIDPTEFGFAKMKYAAIERERRWICDDLPEISGRATEVYLLNDLYITNTQLRLRDAQLSDGTPVWPRLARKVDVDESHRLITSIYLNPEELALIKTLPGAFLKKTRHIVDFNGQRMGIDQFSGVLKGLILVEAEFDDDASMEAFQAPDWVVREVTDDLLFSGGHLSSLSEDEARLFVTRLAHGD